MEAEIVGQVLGLLVIDNEGTRLLAKYYHMTFASVDEELNFERRLFQKASKMAARTGECMNQN